MPVIKPTCLRDLKLRINIVDVVGRVVTLRKAGSQFKGLSPFTQEKTPSFYVSPDKGFYKCFSTGKAGDIITFVRETEQLTFTEAVETLGKRFGVPIEYEEGSGGPSREERSLRQELFDLHDLAAEHLHQVFREKGPAGDYMREYWTERRRFSMELADEFRIGATDAQGSGLAAAVLKKGFSEDAIRQSSLFYVRDGALPTLGTMRPRFRGRLMIPIRDHQGRVVAFTARQTDLTPKDDPSHEAKYVNSSETPIFTKGHLLFNLDRARQHAKDGHPFVMVEGQLDALRSWSVGIKTAIAPQGTAITEQQLHLLRRYHSQVECFFDGDKAGRAAALRFLPMALKAGLEVRFLAAAGDAKIDPDVLFLERGLAAYEDLRGSALGPMAFACRAILPDAVHASAEQKARAAQEVRGIVNHAESHVVRAAFLKEAAVFLRVDEAALLHDAAAHTGERFRPVAAATAASRAGEGGVSGSSGGGSGAAIAAAPSFGGMQAFGHNPEHHLLWLCLHFEQFGPSISISLPHEWIDSTHTAGILLNRFLAEFEHGEWPGRDHLDGLLETDEERAMVASLLFDSMEVDDPSKVAIEAIQKLRARSIEPRLRQIDVALAAGGGGEGAADPIALIRERTDLQRQLRAPIILVGHQ
ncbi:DNA primase, catalytic core [Opitutaceae bacterium TAV1]|nr:DNA primase, catalytic core [Opitutaceae bacterium TAV1]